MTKIQIPIDSYYVFDRWPPIRPQKIYTGLSELDYFGKQDGSHGHHHNNGDNFTETDKGDTNDVNPAYSLEFRPT